MGHGGQLLSQCWYLFPLRRVPHSPLLKTTALGLAMMITMLFTVGSLEDAIAASSPFQNSFTNTGSTGVNVALTLILALLIGAANITSLATTSREVWAFARDGGIPGHRWISRVSPEI